jgi:DNA-binding winged helix-turn-helix (wHTH) protein
LDNRSATQRRAERFVGKRRRLIGRKSPAFWPNITVSKLRIGLVQKSLCASGRAGWRTKPAGRMHHIAQVCANPMLRFEHMSGPAAYGKLKFGPFELSIGERSLRREGVLLPLGGRALAILIYLAERPGEIITRQELIGHVWSDVIVQEGSLRVHVAAIRKALGDGQHGNRYIANIKGQGYSFVGTVERLDDGKNRGSNSRNSRGKLAARPLMLIGREAAVAEVRDWIRQGRLVTLVGPGGIERTTVAVAADHDADVRLIAALIQALKARL